MLHWQIPAESCRPEAGSDREVELKLAIDPVDLARVSSLSILPNESECRRQLSIYFDTPKAKLNRQGWLLRIRRIGDRYIQTIKRSRESAGLFDRDEWEKEVSAERPDRHSLADTPLEGLLGKRATAKLVPVFSTDIDRTTWLVTRAESVIEISLDVGEIAAGKATDPICELELELKQGPVRDLLATAQKIAGAMPVRIGVLSKSERGLALARGAKDFPVKATPVALEQRATVAEGFTSIIISCLKHFRLNEPLLVEQHDSEALHQLRVAIRRIRSALWLFRPAVDDAELKRISERLRSFTRELGTARNIDVILAAMRPDDPARHRLEQDNRLLYGRIIRKLGSKAFRKFILDLLAWAHTGAWRDGKQARKRLMSFAARRLDLLWNRIEERAADLSSLTDDERHRLRIDTKKIRYALQFLEEPLRNAGKAQGKFARAAEGVQDSLGLLNDLATTQRILVDKGQPWLIERETARQQRATRRYLRKLVEIGPYWRSAKSRPMLIE